MKNAKLLLGAVITLAALISIEDLLFVSGGRHHSSKPARILMIKNVKAQLIKQSPFLGNVERCSWVTVVAYDGSKG